MKVRASFPSLIIYAFQIRGGPCNQRAGEEETKFQLFGLISRGGSLWLFTVSLKFFNGGLGSFTGGLWSLFVGMWSFVGGLWSLVVVACFSIYGLKNVRLNSFHDYELKNGLQAHRNTFNRVFMSLMNLWLSSLYSKT